MMLRAAPHTSPPTADRGLPLLSGALVATLISVLLWSMLWIGLAAFQ